MALNTEPRWSLSQPVLEKLLARLSPDPELAAREYELVRRKLVDFFGHRRGEAPEAMADETIDRVARRIFEGEAVQNMRAYFYGIAKRVLLEAGKQEARARAAAQELRTRALLRGSSDDEARANCLKRCLWELSAEHRELIVNYYHGQGVSHLAERKDLARRLGLTYVTLKTRAHRVRNQLRECLRHCLEAGNAETIGRPQSQDDREG